MFCLVKPPHKNGGIFRFNGSGMLQVPDPDDLGGDQIILAALGLRNDIMNVSASWFDSWPIIPN